MPQLNPLYWFSTFFLVWLVLTFLAPKKIVSHMDLNKPELNPASCFVNTTPIVWTWPW